jgi:glucosamine 6-phosphate synthetase-like amidotransferase/phosphosugar isomerase protein
MEKRITTLEVTATQTCKSMDHLERSVADLRSDMHHSVSDLRSEMHHSISGLRNELNSSISGLRTEMQSAMSLIHSDLGSLRRDVDRKFIWMMGTQIAALVVMMSAMAKLVHLF